VNDCGTRDIWPVFAGWVTTGYGSSGCFGFGHTRVKDRFFDVGHSGFFAESFIEKYWKPYLSTGQIVGGVLPDRPTAPWWISILTVVKFRWIIVLFLVAGVVSAVKMSGVDQGNFIDGKYSQALLKQRPLRLEGIMARIEHLGSENAQLVTSIDEVKPICTPVGVNGPVRAELYAWIDFKDGPRQQFFLRTFAKNPNDYSSTPDRHWKCCGCT
jgi:hypothetical protein